MTTIQNLNAKLTDAHIRMRALVSELRDTPDGWRFSSTAELVALKHKVARLEFERSEAMRNLGGAR